MPNTIEAEQGVLGSLLIDPEALDQVIGFLRVYYVRIVERTGVLRQLIRVTGEIAALAYEETDAALALEQAERLIFDLSQRFLLAASTDVGMNELMAQSMEALQRRYENRGRVVGVPTGYSDLDALLGGLQRSDLRESGSIEMEADVVMFLYRDELYKPQTERRSQADIIVAKQRNGPQGSVVLYFQQANQRFRNLEMVVEPDGEEIVFAADEESEEVNDEEE